MKNPLTGQKNNDKNIRMHTISSIYAKNQYLTTKKKYSITATYPGEWLELAIQHVIYNMQ